MKILIAMAGSGHRFAQAGYTESKPLIPVNGKPMVERVIENIKPKCRQHEFIFVVHSKKLTKELIDVLNKYNGTIIATPFYTDGAAITAYMAKNFIDSDEPLIIAACDQLIDIDIEEFIDFAWNTDGALLTFPDKDPSHSYCVVKDDFVSAVVEKSPTPPSEHSNIGIYFYKKGSDFCRSAENMINNNDKTNGEFYVAPTYNYMIGKGKKVKIYEIPKNQTHLIGTPKDLESYLSLWRYE